MLIRKREYLALIYFISRIFFLGIGFTSMYHYSKKDTWISMILGYLLGNIFIYLYDNISIKTNYNILNFLNKKTIISKIYKLLFFIIYFSLLTVASIIFTNFVKVYYLFDTPIWATMFLLFAVCYYGSVKNEHTIIRAAFILLPVSIFLVTLNFTLLTPIINPTNFLPILTTSSTNIITSSLIFAILTTLPNILLLDYKIASKSKYISYAFVALTIFLINFFITSILGEYLISNYSYPEYMVLRRIRFLDFIENIENFASILWYFDVFIIITLTLTKLRKLFIRRKTKLIIPTFLIIISILSSIIFTNYFKALNLVFEKSTLLFGIFLLLTTFILNIAIKDKK